MNNIPKKKQDIVQKMAQQVAQEPLEILKSAGQQISGAENPEPGQNILPEETEELAKPPEEQELKEKLEIQGQRRLEALQREIQEIQNQKLVSYLQAKIAAGETIYLTDYPQLSSEEKQVLTAQMLAVKGRESAQEAASKPLVEPSTKPDRKFAGEVLGAKRQRERVERPLPPSG